jgi:hypothetical protein
MRTDFSPTAEAARLLTARDKSLRPVARQTAAAPTNPRQPDGTGERWCEWPRGAPATRRVIGIWQALQEIQARHA